MRLSFLALPLLAATTSLAQAQHTEAPKTFPIPTAVPIDGCPVGMTAQQRGTGQTLWTISREDSGKLQKEEAARAGTGVHVELRALNTSIRQVELAVYYVAPGARVLPIGESSANKAGLRKTFNLSAQNGAAGHLAGDLLVGPAAGITRVHLISVDYADGTSWHAGHNNICSVEPNGFLLIDTH